MMLRRARIVFGAKKASAAASTSSAITTANTGTQPPESLAREAASMVTDEYGSPFGGGDWQRRNRRSKYRFRDLIGIPDQLFGELNALVADVRNRNDFPESRPG